MRWRRRPLEVEAILFTGRNVDKVKQFIDPFILTRASDDSWFMHHRENLRNRFIVKKNFMIFKDDGHIHAWPKELFLLEYERV